MWQISILSTFSFGTNLGLTGGKYFMEINVGIKAEFRYKLEILDLPNFNKFWEILILGPILA